MEGFPLGAPANAALYGTRRTTRYLSLETQVAEAVSAAHGEVPDAKPRQTEVRLVAEGQARPGLQAGSR